MPPKGLKINNAQLFIEQPGGKMIPLGNIKEVEEIVLSDEDGNKAISHIYEDMTLECELENVKWYKIMPIFSNNQRRYIGLPLQRKSQGERNHGKR